VTSLIQSSFIANLDASTIEALITTAPRSQAEALKNMLYMNLAGKASIRATIPVN
jgi:hypothetical protein